VVPQIIFEPIMPAAPSNGVRWFVAIAASLAGVMFLILATVSQFPPYYIVIGVINLIIALVNFLKIFGNPKSDST
jgi:hypothetical protein